MTEADAVEFVVEGMTSQRLREMIEAQIAELPEEDRVLWMRFTGNGGAGFVHSVGVMYHIGPNFTDWLTVYWYLQDSSLGTKAPGVPLQTRSWTSYDIGAAVMDTLRAHLRWVARGGHHG